MIYIRYQYLSQQCQISNPRGRSDASLLKSETLQSVQAPIVQRDKDALLRSECDGEARVSGLRRWGMTWKIFGKTFRISKHGKNQVTSKCNHNWPEVKTHFGALHSPCGTDFRPALSDATAEWAEKVDQCASNVDKCSVDWRRCMLPNCYLSTT